MIQRIRSLFRGTHYRTILALYIKRGDQVRELITQKDRAMTELAAGRAQRAALEYSLLEVIAERDDLQEKVASLEQKATKDAPKRPARKPAAKASTRKPSAKKKAKR